VIDCLPPGALFDTVAYLVLACRPAPLDDAWGARREVQSLFLVDDSLRLLCLRWVRSPTEPLPKLIPFQQLCVVNARWDYVHEAGIGSGGPLPPALAQWAADPRNRTVCHASAESVGFTPCELSSTAPPASSHLRARYDELDSQADALLDNETLSSLGGVVLELVHGRLQPPPPTPVTAAPPPLALLPPTTPCATRCAAAQPTDSALSAAHTGHGAAPLTTPLQPPQAPALLPPAHSSPSLPGGSDDVATPRSAAVRTAVLQVLQAAADGLSLEQVVERVGGLIPAAESGGADAVGCALEALERRWEVYRHNDLWRS